MTRAIRLTRTGGPEVLEFQEITLPELKAGQARVRQLAIGVTIRDGLKIEIGQRFPLAEAASAHRALESRATTCSTLLTL